MKKVVLLLLYISSIITLKAQSNEKLGLALYFSPDYSYRSLLSNDSLSKAVSVARDNQETAIFTYTAGASLSRKIFGIIAIETGLNYNKRGYVFDSSATAGNYSLNQTYIYNYLQIPVKLKIFIPHIKRYNLYITGGISGMMLLDALKNSIETKNGLPTVSNEKLKEDVVKKFNYNILFGLGLDYRITKRFFLKIEPSYSKTMESIRKEKINTFLYSGGINLGLLFILKK
jgi:hypothetical protein